MTIGEVRTVLVDICDMFEERQEELSALDQIAGDGDHGVTMARGMRAAKEAISRNDLFTFDELFHTFGDALIQAAGGAIGALFGAVFLEFGNVSKDCETFGGAEFIDGLKGAQEVIMEIGGAKVGDKTLVDPLDAVNRRLGEVPRASSLGSILGIAEAAAKEGVEATVDMVARRGRSKYTKEKSKGHKDPGATSFYYTIRQFNISHQSLEANHDQEANQ
ncbi:MAG: dihydroxyacetone kinase subunit DhaL [Candidatus Izemoplasmataceae bacterium]